MDPARSPAVRDRAERQVFEALPELDAVARRALALAAAGVTRTGIASDIGLGGAELSAVLAQGRKALRRRRRELASGGRCERAERALSDRLDDVLAPLDARFLDAHMARCERCRTHERELAAALDELRASVASKPRKPAAPPRAQLRVVPAPALLPPAPEPAALEPAPVAPPPPTLVPEPVSAPVPEPLPEPEPIVAEIQRPTPAAAPAPARHQRIRAALPVAVAALIAVGLIAAAIALLSQLGNDSKARAPWDGPNAPIVHPPPISDQ